MLFCIICGKRKVYFADFALYKYLILLYNGATMKRRYNMRVIAKRKKGLDWLYGIFMIMFAAMFFVCVFTSENSLPAIFMLVTSVILGIVFFNYIRTPKDIISADDGTGIIYLHSDNVTVNASSLIDISYKNARAKGIRYKWGTIIIETPNESYSFNYVADCEAVAKELTRIMYLHKNK